MKHFILSLLFFICIHVNANDKYNLRFSQISTEDGLSQNTARAILKDEKGFIWIGTLDGLNRYDGHRIITYKPKHGEVNTLSDQRIADIHQDSNGYLWIKTYKNEYNCYNPKLNIFIDYLPENINKDYAEFPNYYESTTGVSWLWSGNNGCIKIENKNGKLISKSVLHNELKGKQKNCRFLFEDSNKSIWIGGNKGVFQIKNDEIKHFGSDSLIVKQVAECHNKLYFITSKGILKYDIKNKTYKYISPNNRQNDFYNITKLNKSQLLVASESSGISIFNTETLNFSKPEWTTSPELNGHIQFIRDKNHNIWIYNNSGIVWYYNQEKKQVKRMTLIPLDIMKVIDLERYHVFIDSNDLVWITTYGNGIFTYDTKTDVLCNYKYSANANSPASNYLLDITEDQYGNIWIGSEYAGIIKVVKSNYNTQVVYPEKENSIGKNNNVRSVFCDSKHKIWIGTKNGSLYRYNQELSEKEHIQDEINPYVIIEDKNNNIWVGTKGQGVYVIDRDNYTVKQHYINSDTIKSLSNNSVFSILKDSKERTWIGTFGGGLNLLEGSEFKHFFTNQGNLRYIRHLHQDKNGTIWLASSDGIVRFNPDELIKNPNAYLSYKMNLNDINSIACNDIKTIFEDSEGIIWIGSAGGGLSKFIPKTTHEKEYFNSYTTKDGLAGDIVSGIMEDNQKNLWVSTENGISKFERQSQSFITYKFSEKTYGNHFNENANTYCSDGNMVWGTLDGLLVFNPNLFVPNNHVVPVSFTNLLIHDQLISAGKDNSPINETISYSQKIKLNHNQNTFTLEFASLDLEAPQKNKYSYKLENYDTEWSSISNSNSATYKNLPHGKYTFWVKGTNADGIWNDEPSMLNITITAPFWLSWYAYITYTLLLLCILYFTWRTFYKINQLQNNVKVEKELTSHKLRFFTNISHEFRTPLTLIRGAVENINEQSNVPEQIERQVKLLNKNTTVLTRLIDQLLEFRKIENSVLKLNLEETDIIDFSKDIFDSFLEVAKQKNINYSFLHEVDSYKIFIDRKKIDKILYNLLSNAFKFVAKNGEVKLLISFNNKQNTCLIEVKDNGIGIDKDKQHLLFSRFMQINFSSAGTGVGLSLVKEFVEVHKGKIWYENNMPKGSIFNVEISTDSNIYSSENFVHESSPTNHHNLVNSIIIPPDLSIEKNELPQNFEHKYKDFTILIIDDNDDIRHFLHDEFAKYFHIELAENGKEGLEKAIDINPYLIICDVMMPEMDGFEVTRCLKENFNTCHIPIILLTAHSSQKHQLEGIQSGADAYVMKPFSLKYLSARIFKLIEQREQLKKRFSNEYILDGDFITTTNKDKEFFELIDKILDENITNTSFSVDLFAELAKQRRTIFYKKVKSITGQSPNDLIKLKRMKRAAELLIKGDATVSEIAYKVGFEDPFYFSKCFKAQYNCSPSKYGKEKVASSSDNINIE